MVGRWVRLVVAATMAMLLASPIVVYAGHLPITLGQTSVGITETASTSTTSTTVARNAQTASTATATTTTAQTATSAAASSTQPLAPQGEAVWTRVPRGFQLESHNSTLALYIERCTGEIAVKDKRSGLVWLSNPRLPHQPVPTCPNGVAKLASTSSAQETSPVYAIQYTDYQREVPKLLLSSWDNSAPQIEHLPNGDVRLIFSPKQALKAAPISFAFDIHLGKGYFDLTIPQSQIKEQINNTAQTGYYLETIEPLPFFGAGADNEQGYMVLPDGSGALVRFKAIHPDYLQPFNQEVFGQSLGTPMAAQLGSGSFQAVEEPVLIPAFGIATKQGANGQKLNGAFVEIATQGQYDAIVDGEPSGYITRYYHGGFQLVYRRIAAFPRNRYSFVNRLALPMITGDRSIRIYLLNGQQANYAGMAAAYRSYLLNSEHVSPLPAQQPTRLNLSLIMGAEKQGLIGKTFVAATTFRQAEEILQTLRSRGVKDLQLTLQGWNRDGLYQASPNRMPPDNRLGGPPGLRHLTSYARSKGVPIFLLDDFEDAYSGQRGFSARNDAMRGANKLPLFSNGAGLGQSLYLLNPIVEMYNFVLRDIPKEKLLGASGSDLLYFGEELAYDTNSAHPLTRQQYADWNMKIADYIRQELGHVAIEGGNSYVLKHTQNVRQVPVDDSHWQFEDQAIPFYEMVMHGFVRYTPETYANLRSDPQAEFLREIEYGAVPSFQLTYIPTSRLNLALLTYTDWSSTWTEWIDELVREYEDVNVQLAPTFNQFMVDHQQLAPNIFETSYANGTKVIVNYTNQRFVIGNIAVDALSYAVIPPGS
ncbi:MAG: DUF5696 domain-containing protein [Chloroflexi bacterium]|nr:DUF5696 domain-containing protein [Chloroflexota bacterium]